MRLRQLRGWLVRLTGSFNQEKQERELALELESHLQMHIEDNLQAGFTPVEARRQAFIKLGGLEPAKETCRRQLRFPFIDALGQDIRYGMRMLIKRRGFTVIALVSLGLAIGANTAIFSVINSAALRPLPVEHPEQLVSLSNTDGSGRVAGFSYPNYKDYRDRNDVFSGLIGYRFAPLSVSHDGVNERLWGYLVTGNYFEVLGVRAALGRMIAPDDDRLPGGHPLAVVSHRCWLQRFGADASIIGKSLIVNGRGFTVIGVAPPGFFGTEIIAEPQFWFPMAMQAEIEAGSPWLDKRDVEQTLLIGRLKPGVTVVRAQAALNSIASQLENEYPAVNKDKRVVLSSPGSTLMGAAMVGVALGFAGLLMIVVGFVLLLACTNLANLLLARAAERRAEIAVRLALGSSRPRLVQQLLTESMLLALASGAVGSLLAYWLLSMAGRIRLPAEFPLLIDLHIDYRVLIFTCLTSAAAGVLFGLLPALQATKLDLLHALKRETSSGGYRGSWSKGGLIVLQVALSLVLLAGSGLTLRALTQAQTLNLGFDPRNAVAVSFDPRLQGYDDGRSREFQKRLLQRVRALPGVQYAGLIDLAPVNLHFTRTSVFIEGQTAERTATAPRAMASVFSPGYVAAIGARLVQGRDFTEQDDENAPRVVIINETFARRFWPGEDPLGKRFSRSRPDSPPMQVVGVLQDGKYAGLSEDPQPYMCRPLLQVNSGGVTLIARTTTDPQTMLAVVRDETQRLDQYMPLSAETMTDRMAIPLLPARIAAFLFGVFGLLALILAAIGIYGVMSYAVSQRTREIGVRVALGASRSDVLRLAMGHGIRLVLIGVAAGIAAAMALTSLMRSFLFGVSATDPMTYAGVALLLSAVAMTACYIPANRATKVDPMSALRNE